jgi:hypothetical protein
MADRALLCGLLLEQAKADGAGTWTIDLDPPNRDTERTRAAEVLHATWDLIARREGFDPARAYEATSEWRPTPETGGWFVPVLVVLGAGVYCAVLAFGIQRAAEVLDNQLARNSRLRELVAADEAAAELIRLHLHAEEIAGKPLPLSAATRAGLDALDARRQQVAAQLPPPVSPLPTVPDVAIGLGALSLPLIAAGLLLIGAKDG